MNRTVRLSAVPAAGLAAVLLAGCGSSPSAVRPPLPLAPSGVSATPPVQGAPGSGTLTLSGNHGVYALGTASCEGDGSPSGVLVLIADTRECRHAQRPARVDHA